MKMRVESSSVREELHRSSSQPVHLTSGKTQSEQPGLTDNYYRQKSVRADKQSSGEHASPKQKNVLALAKILQFIGYASLSIAILATIGMTGAIIVNVIKYGQASGFTTDTLSTSILNSVVPGQPSWISAMGSIYGVMTPAFTAGLVAFFGGLIILVLLLFEQWPVRWLRKLFAWKVRKSLWSLRKMEFFSLTGGWILALLLLWLLSPQDFTDLGLIGGGIYLTGLTGFILMRALVGDQIDQRYVRRYRPERY